MSTKSRFLVGRFLLPVSVTGTKNPPLLSPGCCHTILWILRQKLDGWFEYTLFVLVKLPLVLFLSAPNVYIVDIQEMREVSPLSLLLPCQMDRFLSVC